MIICPYCKEEIESGSHFCDQCGKLMMYCMKCGHVGTGRRYSIGVSQQSVNKYENHSVEPDIAVLVRIADIFNTSVDFLIGRTAIRRAIEATHVYELNDEEKRLIDSFRALNPKQRKSVFFIMECYNDML